MSAQLDIIFDRAPLDPGQARAQARANLATTIEDRLICDTPAARNTDPATSHVAAQAVRLNGVKASLQKRLLEVVKLLPGLTVVHYAKQLGLDSHRVGRRLSDLKNAGRIRADGEMYVEGLPYTTWWPA